MKGVYGGGGQNPGRNTEASGQEMSGVSESALEKPFFSLHSSKVICSGSWVQPFSCSLIWGPLVACSLFLYYDIWPPLGEKQICFLQKPSWEITREEAEKSGSPCSESENRHFLVGTHAVWECVEAVCPCLSVRRGVKNVTVCYNVVILTSNQLTTCNLHAF